MQHDNVTPGDTILAARLRAGLEAALKICPPADMARAVGVSVQAVWNWRERGFVPPGRVLAVEKAVNGRVSRHRLRPDYYPRSGLIRVRTGSHNA